VLYGYFGKDVNITNGTYTYCCQPKEGSTVHLHTGTLGDLFPSPLSPEIIAKLEVGDYIPHSEGLPVYRLPRESRHHHSHPDHNRLYHYAVDPEQTTSLHGTELERTWATHLKEKLRYHEAPPCQFQRLNLPRTQGKV
tara:strand:+ start:116 stop:529 length:414 start_codon:yes stop_codon:yes gene_type:complete